MRFPDVAGIEARGELFFHAHRFLLRTGLAIGNVFAWIFVFEYFSLLSNSVPRAFAGVLIVYALSQGITLLVTPIAATLLARGAKRMLTIASLAAASAFVVLGGTFGGYFDESPTAWGIAAFAILLGVYRAFYFIPYELNRELEHPRPHGRALYEILLALVPAFAGATLVLEAYAPLKLLFGAAAFAGISILPALYLHDIRERFSFSYGQTFRELFAARNRPLLQHSFLEGIQGASLFLVWPIAIFLIVGWSYVTLGIVFSATLLLTILSRVFFRKTLRRELATYSPTIQVIVAVSAWVVRLSAGTPIGVVLADLYAYAVPSRRGTLHDPFVFEQAADNGSFVDEYTALKEIGMALGRIALITLLCLAVFLLPLIVVFGLALALAALASGASVLLAENRVERAY